MSGDIERVREALSYVPANDREMWVRMAMAVKSELGDAGRLIWDAWSQQDPSYREADASAVWRSIRPNGGISGGSLFYEAKLNGWRDDGTWRVPTPDEMPQRRQAAADNARDDDAAAHEQRLETRALALRILSASGVAARDHPYLVQKGVSSTSGLREILAGDLVGLFREVPRSNGVPLGGRILLVPVVKEGDLSTLEMIDSAGRKAALPGRGTKTGGYWSAQPLPDGDGAGLIVLVGEGVATVLSAKEATEHLGFAALANTNLANAVLALRQRLPAAELVILADLVKATSEPDPHAVKTARMLGCRMAIPNFEFDRPPEAKDFNDMAALQGHDAVREAINGCEFISAEADEPSSGPAKPDMTIVVSRRGQAAPMFVAEDEHCILRSLDIFGPVMTPWIQRVAESKSAPVQYVAQSVIGSVSGVVGASRWIEARPGWREPCITWHANVGDPSSNKSPAADPAADALAAIERQWASQYDEALRSHELKKVLVNSAREAWESDVEKAQKEGLAPPPLPADAVIPPEPQPRRVKIADATTESVAQILSGNPRGVVCYRDELAAFVGAFNKYGGGSDRAFWLETYGGRFYTVDRKKHGGSPIRVEHMAVAIVGGIQPERLDSMIIAGEDDGFSARFLYSWPGPVPRIWQTDGYDVGLLERVLTRLASLEFELIEFDEAGQPIKHVPRVLGLSPAATAAFSAWWQADQNSANEAEGLVKSAHGKGPGQVLRLALVIELMTWSPVQQAWQSLTAYH